MSRSSTKAEYHSLASTIAELCWFKSLFSKLHLVLPSTPLVYCDNLRAISLAWNPVLHARTKHVELDLHFVRDKVISGELRLQHVPTIDQIADCLTKPLSLARFQLLRDKLTMFSPPCA